MKPMKEMNETTTIPMMMYALFPHALFTFTPPRAVSGSCEDPAA
jgi:hypothetical protein